MNGMNGMAGLAGWLGGRDQFVHGGPCRRMECVRGPFFSRERARRVLDYFFLQFPKMEPLLTDPGPKRWVLFPVVHKTLWELYKKQVASFWTPEELGFTQDTRDSATLSENEQHFIKHVLAFLRPAMALSWRI